MRMDKQHNLFGLTSHAQMRPKSAIQILSSETKTLFHNLSPYSGIQKELIQSFGEETCSYSDPII